MTNSLLNFHQVYKHSCNICSNIQILGSFCSRASVQKTARSMFSPGRRPENESTSVLVCDRNLEVFRVSESKTLKTQNGVFCEGLLPMNKRVVSHEDCNKDSQTRRPSQHCSLYYMCEARQQNNNTFTRLHKYM